MSRRDLDADAAVTALTYRLRDWGVPDPNMKARAFIDDLQGRGWKVVNEGVRPQPPRKADECPEHAGQYASGCGGCAADAQADDDTDRRVGPGHLSSDQARAALRAALAEARQQTAARTATQREKATT